MTKLSKTSDLYTHNDQLNDDAIKGIAKHLDREDMADNTLLITLDYQMSKC